MILQIFTAITTALIAGLMYAYSCSVNPGLGRLPDSEYIRAMQSINRAILNPLFFISFIGTLLLLPLSTWLHYRAGLSNAFMLMLIATLVYVIGVFGVTMFGNVPLNDAMDKFNVSSANVDSIAKQRIDFEIPWNRLHTIRTLASMVSLVLVIIACVTRNAK